MSGCIGGGWARAVSTENTRGKHSQIWANAPKAIETLARRVAGVQIENSDFRIFIPSYDRPGTLFYCDPPYVGTEDYYSGGFDENAHRDLAKLLHNTAGKVMLSYYDCPLVTELYPGWRRATWQTPKWSEKANGTPRQRATELLLMNFDEHGEKIPEACNGGA
jgi:DNA adenine methylase